MEEPVIDVITLETELEKTLIEGMKTNSAGKKEFVVSPDITKMIMEKLKELKDLKVILCSPSIRKYLRQVIERNFPSVSVISYH